MELIFQAVPSFQLPLPLIATTDMSINAYQLVSERGVGIFSLGRGGNFSRRRIELEAICRSAHTLLSRRKLICTSNVTSTTFSPRDIRLTAKNRIHRRGPLLLSWVIARATWPGGGGAPFAFCSPAASAAATMWQYSNLFYMVNSLARLIVCYNALFRAKT